MNSVDKAKMNRRKNLSRWVKGADISAKELAKDHGVNYSLLSNHINGKPIGERAARKYETAFKLERMSLDESSSEYTANVSSAPRLTGEKLPLISSVTAGGWNEAFDAFEVGMAEDWYSTTSKHGPRTYCLRVVGDSMFNPHKRPSYFDGDIIVVDPDQAGAAGNSDRVIALLSDESMVMDRRVTFKTLVIDGPDKYLAPINHAFPQIHDPFEVIGLVLHGIYE